MKTKNPQTAPSPNIPLGLVMLGLMASELMALYTKLTYASYIAGVLVIIMLLIGFRSLRLREFYLLSLVIALLLLVIYQKGLTPKALEVIFIGLERASFLASFVLLLGLLREGAITSPAILSCGRYITQQPPRKRFMAVMLGSHFFSTLLNLGAISLLTPIVQRGLRAITKNPDGSLDEIGLVRERRQLTALIRGFSWFLIWSPTSVTQAILPTLLLDIDAFWMFAYGISIAFMMMAIAWVEDIIRWQPLRNRLMKAGKYPVLAKLDLPKKSFANLGTIFLVLSVTAITLALSFNVSMVSGVMLTCPIVLCVWVYLQPSLNPEHSKLENTKERLSFITYCALPASIREAVALGTAGFIGTLAAFLLHKEVFILILQIGTIPNWLLLLEISILVWLLGQIGLSPVTMAVFLGTALASLPELPVDVTFIGLAIACGTALCTLGAPFASGILVLSRASGYKTTVIAWTWNFAYSLVVIGVLAGVYYVLVTPT